MKSLLVSTHRRRLMRKKVNDFELIKSAFLLRKFSGTKTLEAGMKMNDFMVKMVVESLKRERPGLKKRDIIREIKKFIGMEKYEVYRGCVIDRLQVFK